MTKYILSREDELKNTAGEKAKEDIKKILMDDGFKTLNVKVRETRFSKVIFTKHDISKKLNLTNPNDIIFIQYPIASRYTTKVILNECKKKKIKTVCFIHDLESLRLYKNDARKIKDEINILKEFDCLIAHNSKMMGWLKKCGIPSNKLISLEIFDYLNNNQILNLNSQNDLVFAGNLVKSKFLTHWNINKKLKVFGINPDKNYPRNIQYCGVKSPEELPKYLDGSFGLVWDGTTMITNDGVYGEYTKYNNPHKVSLYLSCGLPVIVWKEAAIAEFIENNGLGLTVASLDDLPGKLENITENDYMIFLSNVEKIMQRIRSGYFTSRAVKKALTVVRDN